MAVAAPTDGRAVVVAAAQIEGGAWSEQRRSFGEDGPTDSPSPLWRFRTGGPVSQPITIKGGALFVVGGASVHALGVDGVERWANPLGPSGPVALTGRGLAVGLISGGAALLHEGRGSAAQRFLSAAPARGAAVEVGEELAWVGEDGVVYGQTGWTVPVSTGARYGGCSDGTHLFVSTEGGELVSLTHAGVIWRVPLPGPGFEHPVTDGQVVVAAYAEKDGRPGGVAAFNASDGSRLWSRQAPSAPAAAPALADAVYLATMGGQLLAIDLGSGSLTWTAINEDAWSSSPAISRTGVYVGDADGRLHRLDKDDGGEIWTLDLISPITGAPAIARGFIYVGLANGDVVALGRKP